MIRGFALREKARPAPAALLLTLAACGSGVSLDADGFGPGDLVFAVHTVDGALRATRLERRAGEPLTLEVDEGSAIAAFRVRPGELVSPAGAPLSAPERSGLEACLTGDPGCGPCTLPSPAAPLLAQPGDACTLPPDLPGALFDAAGDCLGDPSGALCAAPDRAEVTAELARVRARLRVRVPGPDPGPPRPSPDLSNLSIDAWPLRDTLTPLHAWGSGHGLVVGVGDDALLAVRERDGRSEYVRFGLLGGRPLGLTSVPGGFVLASDPPLPWRAEATLFHFLEVAGGDRVLSPVALDWRPGTIARGVHGEGEAVWIYGGQLVVAGFDPSLSVCRSAFGCQTVPLQSCPVSARSPEIFDFVTTADGMGVALGQRAVLTGTLDVERRPEWSCFGAGEPLPVRGEDRMVLVDRFVDAAVRPEGLYLCAQIEVDACSPAQAVVAFAPEPAAPEMEVIWSGPPGPSCRALLPIPGRADGVRARLDQSLFDLRAGEPPVDAGEVAEAYGDAPGADATADLGRADALVLGGPRERAHLVLGSTVTFAHGAETPSSPRWAAVEAAPGGDFWLLDEGGRLHRLDPQGELELRYELGGRGRALAVDPRSGDVLVVGDARFARISGGDPGRAAAGDLPSELGAPRLAASMGAAGFVVLGDGLRAARVAEGGDAALLAVDFDDPSTLEVEPTPSRESDPCRSDRLKPWLAAAGAEGAAWASGHDGLLVRFTGAGGVRRWLPTSADLHGLAADRAERVAVAGFGPTPGTEVGSARRQQVFALELDGGWATPAVERHGRFIETSGLLELIFSRPLALFPSESGTGATPALLPSGYLTRLGGDRGLPYRRVPFPPHGAALSVETGRLLVFGSGGRLALGTP